MIRIAMSEHVGDASSVGAARRAAVQFAESLRLSDNTVARAGLVATELATNLVKHAPGGTILIGTDNAEGESIVLISTDSGAGIANVATAKIDGYSTAGSPGTGLGALQRACTSIEFYTLPRRGTVIVCRVAGEEMPASPPLHAPPRLRVAGISLAKPGQEEDGDAWTAVVGREVSTIVVADGLGHGPAAATASGWAIRVVADGADQSLEDLLQDVHNALRPTRGAAVGIARIHAAVGRVDFIGSGNIAGTIAAEGGVRRMVSMPGIAGHEMRKIQVFSYPWTASSVLILQSDGVSANWNVEHYPGLMQHEPALIGAALYRDHCRGNDDATVVVAKAS